MGSVYSVAQINQYIKNMFEQDFLLHGVSVRGEVSNCKYHTSGHIYFSIKDKNSVLNCVMFAGKRRGLDFRMTDGDKVIVTGYIDVYERDGRYQLYADRLEKEGQGDLYKKFLLLKEELEDMGMFAQEYKKEIPKYAMNVGICTASTGAAIQDIQNISRRRNPYVRLVLYPALVQGEGAAQSIVSGIRVLDKMGLDVIIVGRGGGSIEVLWAFNDEIVARAIFECNTPIISAVGHETDTTIADYVADLRAPTPSAAAELAVFEYRKFMDNLDSYEKIMAVKVKNKHRMYKQHINELLWKIQKLSPKSQLDTKRMSVADIENQLNYRMKAILNDRLHKLELIAHKLEGKSPLSKLSGGYAYVQKKNGDNIRSINDIKENDTVSIFLKDGSAQAVIKEINAE